MTAHFRPAVYDLRRDGHTVHRWEHPPRQATVELERLERKRSLAAAFRVFARLGFDMGGAGHITVRDPGRADHFWVNPVGVYFGHVRVSDLLLVDPEGAIVEGEGALNLAAFAIHAALHEAHPQVVAAAHAHSLYGKAWSSLGRLLDPLTQDACAFYERHGLFDNFSGVVLEASEGARIAAALQGHKALILQNHGLLTVGETVEAAAWRFIAMDNAAQAQLLAEAAGTPRPIPHEVARHTARQVGTEFGGWFSFQPYRERIVREEADFLD